MRNFLFYAAASTGLIGLFVLSVLLLTNSIQIKAPAPRHRVLVYPEGWEPGGTNIYTVKGDTVWVSKQDGE